MIRVEMQRTIGDYGFEAKDAAGHVIVLDSSSETGGKDAGIRPMQGLLMSLGACSAIDIVSILKKQKQQIEAFKIIIEGEREQGKLPSLWKKINVQFQLSGNIEPEKAMKACTLSIEKYCSVAETLRRAGAEIVWEVEVSEE
jgi:putative redox protein